MEGVESELEIDIMNGGGEGGAMSDMQRPSATSEEASQSEAAQAWRRQLARFHWLCGLLEEHRKDPRAATGHFMACRTACLGSSTFDGSGAGAPSNTQNCIFSSHIQELSVGN